MQEKFLIKSMRKKGCLSVILLLFCTLAFAQSDEGRADKFFAGGGLGLSFGRYTLINANPQIGYRFNRFLSGGLGMNLIYESQKEKYPNGADYSKTTMGVTGLSLFTRFYPVQKFFIQVQPEENYIFGNIKYYDTGLKSKIDAEIVPSVLVGGGVATPTQKGVLLFTVMYDVLQNPNSPYGNHPIVNVGYNFNF